MKTKNGNNEKYWSPRQFIFNGYNKSARNFIIGRRILLLFFFFSLPPDWPRKQFIYNGYIKSARIFFCCVTLLLLLRRSQRAVPSPSTGSFWRLTAISKSLTAISKLGCTDEEEKTVSKLTIPYFNTLIQNIMIKVVKHTF